MEHWKLIVYPGIEEDYIELYDLENDPLERQNVAEHYPEIRGGLQRAMDSWLRTDAPDAAEQTLSAEETENMRALGYLGN